ncbi:MAG: class I SAM-dependent methyltransferase [Gemmatimonadaceae bacterium]
MADQVRGRLSPWLRRRRLEMVRPWLQGRVLDFGCGAASVLAELVPPERYLGVEVIPRNFERALRSHPRHRFAPELPTGETFDTIASLAVIEHVPEPEQMLRAFVARLAPGGQVVLTTPHAWFEWAHVLGARVGIFDHAAEEEHQQLFTRSSLARVADAAGLRLVEYRRFLFGANQLFVLRASGADQRR